VLTAWRGYGKRARQLDERLKALAAE
jgi:hypothetical protein